MTEGESKKVRQAAMVELYKNHTTGKEGVTGNGQAFEIPPSVVRAANSKELSKLIHEVIHGQQDPKMMRTPKYDWVERQIKGVVDWYRSLACNPTGYDLHRRLWYLVKSLGIEPEVPTSNPVAEEQMRQLKEKLPEDIKYEEIKTKTTVYEVFVDREKQIVYHGVNHQSVEAARSHLAEAQMQLETMLMSSGLRDSLQANAALANIATALRLVGGCQ